MQINSGADYFDRTYLSLFSLNLKGEKYLCDPRFTTELANLLFKFRTRTYLVKNNFRNNYRNTNIHCPLCDLDDDNQEHLLRCCKIAEVYNTDHQFSMDDIFSNNSDSVYAIATALKKIDQIRGHLLSPEE